MSKYSILVVDDEELLRLSLARDLENEGYSVSMAESGDKAVELLENFEYELIITDLMMEGVGGIELLKCAKEKNNETMVIIITGYGSMDTAIEALQSGAADYMLKPYNKQEVLLRVASCFAKLELNRKVRLYENILPLCCKCKKIRDDTGVEPGHGKWLQLEAYLSKRANVGVTHGYCGVCFEEEKEKIEKYVNGN